MVYCLKGLKTQIWDYFKQNLNYYDTRNKIINWLYLLVYAHFDTQLIENNRVGFNVPTVCYK